MIAIVYASRTGNTAMLAQRLSQVVPATDLIYYGTPHPDALQADTLLVGSWTDKGDCCAEIAAFLSSLHDKKIFLFGTAGFGGSQAYFARVGGKMQQNIPADNTLLGCYLCQGKMPAAVRARYEAMAQSDPAKAKPMLDNFDRALTHPNADDLYKLEVALQKALKTEQNPF